MPPTEQQKPTWKKAYAYCPLCWWNLAGSKVWPEVFTEQAKALHVKEKPNCHENLKIEGQE